MAKSKTRKTVVRKAAKAAPKKAMKTAPKKVAGKVAKAAAKKKSSAPMMAADVKLAITTPVRVGPRRQLSLFPREIPPYRG
jgi:hypothetical protein